MIILPAIDLKDGKCVRLRQGRAEDVTVYGDDPAAQAADWREQGGEELHVVDLDGAFAGEPRHAEVIARIIKAFGGPVEVGGGIRDMDSLRSVLEAGAARAIIGSAALDDPAFLSEALELYGDKIAVGADVRDGKVAVRGWTETTESDVFDFCGRMQDAGVKTVICTDISKDGAMRGTNLELYRKLTETFSMDIIASGGVSALSDVLSLKETGVSGAIIGKAYYSGAVSLAEAIEVAR